MSQMVAEGVIVNQDIVKEDDNKTEKIRSGQSIHRGLKRGRSVTKTKWHHFKLIMAMVGAKRSFAYVIFMQNPNLVVSLEKVQLREPARAPQFIKDFINGGDKEAVFDGEGV